VASVAFSLDPIKRVLESAVELYAALLPSTHAVMVAAIAGVDGQA